MKKMDDGFNNFKHMKQQATLLSLLESQGFLSNACCFVEFGAGKGMQNFMFANLFKFYWYFHSVLAYTTAYSFLNHIYCRLYDSIKYECKHNLLIT